MATKKIKPGHLRQHGEIRDLLTRALRQHGGFMYYTELKAAANGRNIQSTLRRMVDAGYVQYERLAPRCGVYRWNDGIRVSAFQPATKPKAIKPAPTPPKRPPQVPALLTRWTPASPYGNQTCKKN